MKLKWEKNNRVKTFAQQGLISEEDIIPRSTTDNFPSNAATVRMHRSTQKHPVVTVHIRGEGKQRSNSHNNYVWTHCPTLRVTFGADYAGNLSDEVSYNGYTSDVTVDDVAEAVNAVAEIMNHEF